LKGVEQSEVVVDGLRLEKREERKGECKNANLPILHAKCLEPNGNFPRSYAQNSLNISTH
jgi:hypothetical protein